MKSLNFIGLAIAMTMAFGAFASGEARAAKLGTNKSRVAKAQRSEKESKRGTYKGPKKTANKTEGEELGTSHNFDDHGVIGEYQMPDEALAKVENEKGLSDLLGVRQHFKDRLSEASEQE